MICVLISLMFWVLSKLSGQYELMSDFEIHFTLDDQDEILTRGIDQEVRLRFKASGYDLLSLRTSGSKSLEIALDRDQMRKARSSRYYILSRDLPIDRYLKHKGFQGLNPDTLFFRLEERITREVVVELESELSYRKEYGPASAPTIQPSKLVVSGARSMVEGLEALKTEEVRLSDLHSDQILDLKVIVPEGLVVPEPMVTVELMVDRYTEGKISYDLAGLSPGKVLFPSSAELYFIVPIRAYELISESDFDLELRYDTVDQTASIALKKSPDLVSSVRIVPAKVEYVTLKE
jgi:hypothetical protein